LEKERPPADTRYADHGMLKSWELIIKVVFRNSLHHVNNTEETEECVNSNRIVLQHFFHLLMCLEIYRILEPRRLSIIQVFL
jgi:hypothetical protein